MNYDKYRKFNPKYKTPEYEINSFGFRGKEFDINKKAGTYRIVALGGSTTFGSGVKDGFTYPEFLEKILNSKYAKKCEVINAGIGASTAGEIVHLFKNEVIPLAPDMIIINSLFNNFYFSENAYKYQLNLWQKFNKLLSEKSLFYLTLREKMAQILYGSIGSIYKAPLKDMIKNFMEDESFWHDLKAAYLNVIEDARANNIEVAIITQPMWLRNRNEVNCGLLFDEGLQPMYEKAYVLLEEVAAENNVTIIEAASAFKAIPEKHKFFQSDCLHLTGQGNEYLAELVAREILKGIR